MDGGERADRCMLEIKNQATPPSQLIGDSIGFKRGLPLQYTSLFAKPPNYHAGAAI
jgi:hypothetical protein